MMTTTSITVIMVIMIMIKIIIMIMIEMTHKTFNCNINSADNAKYNALCYNRDVHSVNSNANCNALSYIRYVYSVDKNDNYNSINYKAHRNNPDRNSFNLYKYAHLFLPPDLLPRTFPRTSLPRDRTPPYVRMR